MVGNDIEKSLATIEAKNGIGLYKEKRKILDVVIKINILIILILCLVVLYLNLIVKYNSTFKMLKVEECINDIDIDDVYCVPKLNLENQEANTFFNFNVDKIINKIILENKVDMTKVSSCYKFKDFDTIFKEVKVNKYCTTYVYTLENKYIDDTSTYEIAYSVSNITGKAIEIKQIIDENKKMDFLDRYNIEYSNFAIFRDNITFYDESYFNYVTFKFDDISKYLTNFILTAENIKNYDEIFKNIPDPNRPMIALTFDDGPYPPVTRRIINALNEHGGKATFFMVGYMIDNYPNMVKEIYDSGNELGNHTKNHLDFKSQSVEVIKGEVSYVQNKVKNITGNFPKFVRTPYGRKYEKILNNIDQNIVLWNVDTLDWKTRKSESVKNEILTHVSDGSIILMHDIYDSTAKAIEEVLPILKSQGYQFVTVSELLKYKGYNLSKGQVLYCIN